MTCGFGRSVTAYPGFLLPEVGSYEVTKLLMRKAVSIKTFVTVII